MRLSCGKIQISAITTIAAFASFRAPHVVKAFSRLAPACFATPTTRTSRCFLSSSEASDEDLERWERMFYDAEAGEADLDDTAVVDFVSASEVRVVTFDLDNCLWKTGPTIAAANDALDDFLDTHNVTRPLRVEKVMGELFKKDPQNYSPYGGKAPVYLTLLRKDAIQHVLLEHNEYSQDDAQDFADLCFDVWTKARHEVIPSHFASSVITCLEKIQSIQTSSGNPILIGAITDGNSDPRNIPELREFFDFVVNAESVGVSKPDKRMYMEAMNQVAQHSFVQDIFGPFEGTLSEEDVEDMVGPWWLHVGDDFIKDVVPAKELKMRSVWSRELIKKTPDAEEKRAPQKSMEEFVKEMSGKKVIKMEVGADDYLADSLQSEFADAVVDTFAELGEVVADWQSRALRIATGKTASDAAEIESEVIEVVEVISTKAPEKKPIAVNDEASDKFCMFCGTKLPMAAKFCSSCGEKQPDLTS